MRYDFIHAYGMMAKTLCNLHGAQTKQVCFTSPHLETDLNQIKLK